MASRESAFENLIALTNSPYSDVKKLVGLAIPSCFVDVRPLCVRLLFEYTLTRTMFESPVPSPTREGGRRCLRHLRGRRGRGELVLSLTLSLYPRSYHFRFGNRFEWRATARLRPSRESLFPGSRGTQTFSSSFFRSVSFIVPLTPHLTHCAHGLIPPTCSSESPKEIALIRQLLVKHIVISPTSALEVMMDVLQDTQSSVHQKETLLNILLIEGKGWRKGMSEGKESPEGQLLRKGLSSVSSLLVC
jgi:hypothetical protein